MMYEIEHGRANANHIDVLGAWVLYLMVIVSLTGYHLVKIFW